MKKLLVISALLASTAANAGDSFVYGGIVGGVSDLGDGESDTLIGVRAGTGILPLFDIEAGYLSLGGAEESGISVDVTTKYLAVKPTLTLGIVDVYARGGIHMWDMDIKAAGISASDDGTNLMYGVGFDYFINDFISAGASYTRYDMDGGEIDGYELNATFHF